MTAKYESVRHSRCGCVHAETGDALVVCATHVGDVEGRPGMRMRTVSGELTFFPLVCASPQRSGKSLESVAERMAVSLGVGVESVRAAMEAAQLHFSPQSPPEESLCGEEEDLVTGNAPPPPASPAASAELAAWEAHCRVVGRSRVRAYDEAFSLVQEHLRAWRTEFVRAADDVFAKRGWSALSDREKMLVAMCCDGSAGFLREIRAVGERARR